jgi:hypothetical protein
VAPAALPIEDFFSGVVTAVRALPEEAAEEVRQETVRILKASRKPKDNLSGAERRALRTLRTNADLTILPADKGNAIVVLNTSDYNREIGALLGAPTYRMLAKDPTEAFTQVELLTRQREIRAFTSDSRTLIGDSQRRRY